MKYKLAIFDMDGTILNTLEDLADSVNYALAQFNMPSRSLAEVRDFVGNGVKHLIDCAVSGDYSDDIKNQIMLCYDKYYNEHSNIKTKPYDGIVDVITELRNRGVKTAVVSNKPDSAVQVLAKDYFDGLFDYAVGAKEGIRIKPSPDSVNAVLCHFGIDKSEALYIGDSDVDYLTSKNADMGHIIVSWGYRDESFLRSLGAEIIIHSPKEILSFYDS